MIAAPGVWTSPMHGASWFQTLWIALLAAGPFVIVSHEAAAELHHVDGVRRGVVTLTGPHPHHHRVPGATIHQLSDMHPEHVMTVEGLPCTTPARTAVDLAAVARSALNASPS